MPVSRAHRERFYSILDDLSSRIGGGRIVRECSGRMPWPSHGVYFFFEPGEVRGGDRPQPRVVRVGTHAVSDGSKTTLWDRLAQHRGSWSADAPAGGNHRGSVFRRHVGRALITSGCWADVEKTWTMASITPEARVAEAELERRVSEYLGRMRVVWIAAYDEPGARSIRAYVESNAIALLSTATDDDPPSPGWLGRHAPDAAIRGSGLWNVKHVGSAFDPRFLEIFAELAAGIATSGTAGAAARSNPSLPLATSAVQPVKGVPTLERPVLALVACAKKKAPATVRASELYAPSLLFRLAHVYARKTADETLILSARHGVVHPDEVLAPYEQTLVSAGRAERRAWAEMAHRQLRDRPEYRDARTVLWLAGEDYRSDLLPLVSADGKRSSIPMEGLARGKQVVWLQRALGGDAEVEPATTSAPEPMRLRLATHAADDRTATSGTSAPTAQDFARELVALRDRARSEGMESITVTAGELHRRVGGYPGPAHRMPVCCAAMRKAMGPRDAIVAAPPKGNWASLTIRYIVC